MLHVLANEGGYQVFTLAGGDKFWLLFSGLTSLLAIGTGFYLMRGVLAADQGTLLSFVAGDVEVVEDVDVGVVVVVPPEEFFGVIQACIRRGVPVFTEKPAASPSPSSFTKPVPVLSNCTQ